jgi:hypothetical protein
MPGEASTHVGIQNAIIDGELNEFPHLDGKAMERLFTSASLVIARSGYTTVMEMACLGLSRVVLVPTPGQSEQEYLADHLDAARLAMRMDQEELDRDDLDMEAAMKRTGQYSGFAAFRTLAAGDATSSRSSLSGFLSRHPLFQPAGK